MGLSRNVLFFVCATAALSIVFVTRWRRKLEQRRRKIRKNKSSVNIGSIFGMDVGGTLTKIVYFEADKKKPKTTPKEDMKGSDAQEKSMLKRTSSFSQLDRADHIQALEQLYNFMSKENMGNSAAIHDNHLRFYSNILGGKIHFLSFETRNMNNAIAYIGSTSITEHIRTMGCTGGGALKYAKEFKDHLDISVQQMDELGSLLQGMDFALTNVENEGYTFRYDHSHENDVCSSDSKGSTTLKECRWTRDAKDYTIRVEFPIETFASKSIFPYLVVNIGSGVSILKVSAPGVFERVSGSSIGGGTYWGLCRLLTSCATFEEVIDLAESGASTEVDMLVKDIYGGSYDSMGLDSSMVASSFGKMVMKDNPRQGVREEDFAIALLNMISNNIGQVAYLNAQLNGCRKIFFVGSFLRHNPISCRRLAFAIDFWSNGNMEAIFLKHEGYFGALGTFLESAFGKDVSTILSMGHYKSPGIHSSTSSHRLDTLNRDPSCKEVIDQEDNSEIPLSPADAFSVLEKKADPMPIMSRMFSWSKRGLASYRKNLWRYFDMSSSNNSSNNSNVNGNGASMDGNQGISMKRNNSNAFLSTLDGRNVDGMIYEASSPHDSNNSKDHVIDERTAQCVSPTFGNKPTIDSANTTTTTSTTTNSNSNSNNGHTSPINDGGSDATLNSDSPRSFGRVPFQNTNYCGSSSSSSSNNNNTNGNDESDAYSLGGIYYENGAGSEDETSPLNEKFVRRRAALGLDREFVPGSPATKRRSMSQDADYLVRN